MRRRGLYSSSRSISILIVALCSLTCFTPAATAQSANQWRQLTLLEGGPVLALAGDGEHFYTGTNARGIFVSSDNGRTWREANTGLGNLTINALAVTGGNALAATNAGIYRSSDGGQNWTLTGASNLSVRALVVGNDKVFAGSTNGRILCSGDNGQSWSERGALPSNAFLMVLAFSGENLFAGTLRGLYRSADQGQSWTMVTAGLPNNGEPNVSALASNDGTLYLGLGTAYRDAAGNFLPQVYASSDNGQSWAGVGSEVRIRLSPNVVSIPNILAFYFEGEAIYAATGSGLVTYDGQGWIEPASVRGLPIGIRINAFVRVRGTSLLGTLGGVFVQASDGQSWTISNAGLMAANVSALAVRDDAIIASAGFSGTFRSTDNGQSWTAINGIDNGNGRPFPAQTLAVRGSTIFAGTDWGGIFNSGDDGVSWTQINSGLRFIGFLPDFAVRGEDVYTLTFSFVYKLNSNNQEWTQLNINPIPSVNRIAVSGPNIFVAGGNSVLRSTDGGSNFTPVNVGAMIDQAFTVAARGNNVYISAATNNIPKIFISTDNGDNFIPSQTSLQANGFTFSGNTLYAYSSGSGVFFSANNGANWTPINEGLLTRAVTALAVKEGTLLAGTNLLGVFAAINPQLQPGTLVNVSAASFISDAAVATESIVTAYGAALAITTARASTQPLPTTLAGTRVIVRDSTGVERNAPLFFVSPTQVNYQVPPGTAVGAATVITFSANGSSSFGNVMITTIAPGLFSANSTGQGVPAGAVLRVKSDGRTSYEPIARFDSAQNRFVPLPIDLGEETDQLYLILFGTGFRNRSALSNVSLTIGGTDSQVLYAGEAPGFVGLDQLNARLPRSLAGRGEIDVALAVDGKAANTVRINIGGQSNPAYFVFDSPPAPETFVIKLTDPASIQHARDLISGKTTSRRHVTGLIVKSPAAYNPPWSFHLDPASISFFDFAVEVCDASIKYVEEHLNEVGGAFLPGNRWCPWGSRLVKELPQSVNK